ncbi:unnamed protein product, partial [Didymodactylos carnosus]
MRFGIQDVASNDHSTTGQCIVEIDRCCKYSLATNFIVLQPVPSYLLENDDGEDWKYIKQNIHLDLRQAVDQSYTNDKTITKEERDQFISL